MKRILITVSLSLCCLLSAAQTHVFEQAFDSVKDQKAVFKPGGEWFPYPAYTDRESWDRMTEPFKAQIFKAADKYLNFDWELFKPSDYLKYEKTGDRKLALPEEHNRQAIIALTLGELADGTGKYLGKLVDGLWFMCQQYSWAHYQHTGYQASHRTLPSSEEYVISLHGANSAACIAVAYHFFHKEFDRLDPSISKAIEMAMETQVFTPFFNEAQDAGSHKIWTGFVKDNGKKLNNWTPYCDHHVLTCFLLMEKDQDRLLKALRRSVRIMDFYMSDQKSDGACDEGPGYWNMSFGKVYDYARTLYDASSGQADVFGTELIRRMGEYKSKTYFDGGWTLSFGDCTPRAAGSPDLLYRYGKDLGSRELTEFALYLLRDTKKKTFKTPSLNFGQLDGTYRQLETIRYQEDLDKTAEKYLSGGDFYSVISWLRADVKSEFYPETGYAVLRKDKWNLGVKGGHNGESHNHNDVGSGILIWDTMPVILDPGVGTYVKDTFSARRYTIWTMQSQWHACPSINGVMQHNGSEFTAENTACNLKKGVFTTEIARAYEKKAACESWKRTWSLGSVECVLKDEFKLSERKSADVENFPIRGEVALPGETVGTMKAGAKEVIIHIDTFEKGRDGYISVRFSGNLTPGKEVIPIKDKKLLRNLGDHFTRLYFKSDDNAPLSGTYTIKFAPLEK